MDKTRVVSQRIQSKKVLNLNQCIKDKRIPLYISDFEISSRYFNFVDKHLNK